ncbi:hypothetical protein GGX14DRAFT_406252 [Mycena pura]|uniref:Uncharacterized protein n=1 Tax=Mycena pura TaxID=153505 RepID=A0AAD6Y3G3_9AGAR|nr:hypothetical protein GGX14DRAFT_406252 [Mycena pura]
MDPSHELTSGSTPILPPPAFQSFKPQTRNTLIGQNAPSNECAGKEFPMDPEQGAKGYIKLYSTGVPNPQLFARVLQGQSEVILELTTEAVHIGLLEVCVTATFLLMSGRNISPDEWTQHRPNKCSTSTGASSEVDYCHSARGAGSLNYILELLQ